MIKLLRIGWYAFLLLALGLSSCRIERPDVVLSDEQMEDVLYDYHLAKAMGENLSSDVAYRRMSYIESVYKKHHITQEVFDTSMQWFARHPDVLSEVYKRVNDRVKAEREYIEKLIALRDNKPRTSQPGDSVDVWAWLRIYRLSGTALDNKITFTLPADSNFQGRDTIRWMNRFRYSGGDTATGTLPAAWVAMQLVYDTDSMVAKVHRIDRPGFDTLTLYADTLGAMKEVRGFIYYPNAEGQIALSVDKIQLMRYHAKDSLMFAGRADSLSDDKSRVPADRPLQSISRPLQPVR